MENWSYLWFIVLILLCLQCAKPKEQAIRRAWIKENTKPIDLSETSTFDDLHFLKKLLNDKKIVFLGESSHGVSEYNSLKSRIIQYLHQELEFDVLAFECNAADGFAVNLELPFKDAKTALYNCVSTFWHVEENIPLFEYINQQSDSDDKLSIAGIDITQSNGSYAFSRFLKNLISEIDSDYAEQARIGDSLFASIGVRKWTIGLTIDQLSTYDSIKNSQLLNYRKLIEFIKHHKHEFTYPTNQVEAAIFYLKSRIDFIHQIDRDSTYMADYLEVSPNRNKNTQWLVKQFRERLQADNLKFLVEKLYPDKKIMVWAHNTHIEKQNRNRMPFRLSEIDSVYTIGFFNYSGQGCYSFGQGFDGTSSIDKIYDYEIPNDSLRIEQLLVSSGYKNTFLDLKYQKKEEVNSWIFEKVRYAQWDGKSIEEVDDIRSKWDALIVVKNISTPHYINYTYDYLVDAQNKEKE